MVEAERAAILEESTRKLKAQAEQLEQEYEQERVRAKADYEQEIRDLEHKRRAESDEFFRNNKHFYVQNLDEMRRKRKAQLKAVPSKSRGKR